MQREMFEPPGLQVRPKEGLNEPRLWFRRFVIWPEPGAEPIQDRAFGPGLNIIWSPDPVDRSTRDGDAPPPGPGHGAGKTLVCRLLRYCLGEPHFAPDMLRHKISGAFKDGRVGVEVIVDGQAWAVVRSIGLFEHDVVLEGGTLEAAVSADTPPTGMAAIVDLLAERFVTPDVAALVAESPKRAWLLALAWLTRDQECHFGKATEWRVPGGKSGSPAHGLSVNHATTVVRALIGAITPRERQLEIEVDAVEQDRDNALRALERRQWLLDSVLKRVLHDVKLEGQPVPSGDLLGPFLRRAARDRVARVAVVEGQGEFASLAALYASYDQAQADVERLRTEIASNESRASTAAAVARQIESESPGLSASLDEAEAPMCPVCETPIEQALADGCKLSHRLPDVASLRERRAKNERDLRERRADQRGAEEALVRLRSELVDATAGRDKARSDLRAAQRVRDERANTWYKARRVGDDVRSVEELVNENAAAEDTIAQLDETLKDLKRRTGAERDQHAGVFSRIEAHFDPLVRRLLGRAESASGSLRHDGNGLQLIVDFGGERNTPAIDLVKVLAFDLATLCRSIEGATKLPALLIHDSPRTSDLGLSIYHELFHLMRELEEVGPSPLFQYIVTTTSRPPDDLVDNERVRLKLQGSPAAARLLARDL
ncbi:MAG: chromosome segregation protein SMC [Vicinamibacterales bacterium]